MREEVELLEHHPRLAADLLDVADVAGELDTVDEDAPAVVLLESVDAADHRRLARPRRADDDDDLLAGDVEVDVAQRLERAEELLHADQLDHRLAGRGHLRGVGKYVHCVLRPRRPLWPLVRWRSLARIVASG